jgi:hypothetical protein
MTSRFQRIWSSGEQDGGLQTHFGTRTFGYSGQVHTRHVESDFPLVFDRSSAMNPKLNIG